MRERSIAPAETELSYWSAGRPRGEQQPGRSRRFQRRLPEEGEIPNFPQFNTPRRRQVSGAGSVRSSNVPGIDCPGDCQVSYSDSQDIFLEAVPQSGSHFVGWQGACSGTGICSVHMTEDRSVQALFVTTVALDFEADLLAHDAARKADLLRQADRYQAEGLHGIAEHLRHQAEALSLQRPLAGVLPAVDHLIGKEGGAGAAASLRLLADAPPAILPFTTARPQAKKKGK